MSFRKEIRPPSVLLGVTEELGKCVLSSALKENSVLPNGLSFSTLKEKDFYCSATTIYDKQACFTKMTAC